jgi:hypothetical protein
MDPRAKEKHQEEHEDSKKEREAKTTVIVLRITRLPA